MIIDGIMVKYYLIALLAVFLTACSQFCLKVAANRWKKEDFIRLYFNPLTFGAYFVLFIVTLLNLKAYRFIPLKAATFLLPLTFILVVLFSRLFLNERLSKMQLAGTILVLFGVALYSFPG